MPVACLILIGYSMRNNQQITLYIQWQEILIIHVLYTVDGTTLCLHGLASYYRY